LLAKKPALTHHLLLLLLFVLNRAIAIGSAEGFHLAEQAISKSPYEDSWILLKNIHLAPQWLIQLEKKLHSLKPHPNFRLFMTSEIHPKLPANLLRMSHIFVFEPPGGIKVSKSKFR